MYAVLLVIYTRYGTAVVILRYTITISLLYEQVSQNIILYHNIYSFFRNRVIGFNLVTVVTLNIHVSVIVGLRKYVHMQVIFFQKKDQKCEEIFALCILNRIMLSKN